ncbi:MAG: iron-containing alcohol dehydrogenase [Brevinematales bacterium]|nr:iron-containing alcohol dehydrogenase [Brevinematales bacterium]
MPVLEFQIPSSIIYGDDTIGRLPEIATPNGEKVVLVAEKKATEMGITNKVKRTIEGYAYGVIVYEVPTRANTKDLFEGVNIAKNSRADVIIGVGGENVLSVAKAIAQFSTQELVQEEYKSHKRFGVKKVRYIEVPYLQTVSWGIMPVTYIIDETDNIKKPYIDKDSRAQAVIIDPGLTEEVTTEDVIFSAMEGLSYAFDAYISKKASPLSDAFSLKAIEFLSINLKRLALEPANIKIKGNLSMGTLLASLSIYTSALGTTAACAMGLDAVCNFAQPLGSTLILPHVMEFNLTAAANKFIQIGLALGEKVADITVIEAAIKSIESIRRMMIDLKIPSRLSEHNINQGLLDQVSKVAAQYDFLTYLGRPAGRNELNEILEAAM